MNNRTHDVPLVLLGGYAKSRSAKVTVGEAEQIFQDLWTLHEEAMLLAFERRFELTEARLLEQLSGQPSAPPGLRDEPTTEDLP